VQVEGYTILGEIARGGMGVIYRAHDPRLGRDVAIKVVLNDEASPAQLQRFLREGEITASLQHPGILRVHASGVQGGRPYLVYELVEGAQTLSEVLPRVPRQRRLELLRDAAVGLGQAHAQGVVHRDVKPDNLLVDAKGRVRVADFGLASAQGLTRLTRSGAALGTPHYMAPEQIQGLRDEIGPHTDVWALGVVLYEALTDQRPFRGESMLTLSAQIASGLDAPPSEHARDVAPDLDAVTLRALSLESGDRYPDAAAFAADLDACLRGEPPAALVARRRSGRQRATLAALALGGVLLAGAGAALLRGQAPPAQAVSASPTASPPSPTPTPEPTTPLVESPQARRQRVREEREEPLLRRRLLPANTSARALFVDAQRFLVWSEDGGPLQLWQVEGHRLEQLARWGPDEGLTVCADLAPDGDAAGGFVLVGGGQSLHLDVATRQLTPLWRAPPGARRVAVSPDGQRVALVTGHSVRLYDRDGTQRGAAREVAKNAIHELAFSSDGDQLFWIAGSHTLLTASDVENTLFAWDMDPERRPEKSSLTGYARAMALWPDRLWAMVGAGQAIHVYEPGASAPLQSLVGAGSDPDDLQAAFRGQTAHGAGTVKGIWIRADGRRAITFASTKTTPRPLSELRCWDLPSGDEVGRALVWDEYFLTLAVSPDGELLLSGNEDGEVVIWWGPALTEALPR
jgi:serine/threonine protein kinase